MGLSMTVDGSPASCRASARAVRTLGREVEQSATGLAHVRTTAAGAWSGEASERFNARARRMVDAADAFSGGLLTFASALEAQADAIERARSEMQRARSIATGAGIPLAGDTFPSYGEVELKPGQEGPRDHGEAVITRAREAEDSARSTFSTAVETVLGVRWEGEPPVKAGTLQGPSGFLPDLPDFGITFGGPVPGVPIPLPVPVPDIEPSDLLPDFMVPLTAEAAMMMPAVHRRMKGLGDEVIKNLKHPSSPSGYAKGIALGPVKAGYAQWLEDASDKDMPFGERLARAGFVGGSTALGGAAAGYACTQAAVTAPFTPICIDLGSRGGSIVSNWMLEMSDGAYDKH